MKILADCGRGCRVRIVGASLPDKYRIAVVPNRRYVGNLNVEEPHMWVTRYERDFVSTLECIRHHEPMKFKKITGKLTNRPCTDSCRRATCATCKCACAGANHGSQWDQGIQHRETSSW